MNRSEEIKQQIKADGVGEFSPSAAVYRNTTEVMVKCIKHGLLTNEDIIDITAILERSLDRAMAKTKV